MSRHAPKLLTAAALALSALLAPAASIAKDAPAKCKACRTDKSDSCTGAHHEPRIIRFDYGSGHLTWEGCSRPVDYRLVWNEPVEVQVCCVNPYRHSVNVTIAEVPYQEIATAPGLVSSNLLPSQSSPSDKATAKTTLAKASANLSIAKQKVKTLKAPGGPAAKADRPAAIAAEKKAEAEETAQHDVCETSAYLLVFNDEADRLVEIDSFAADEGARSLQIDDPSELTSLGKVGALAKARSVTANFSDVATAIQGSECQIAVPSPVSEQPSKVDDMTSEYLTDLRSRLAAAEETAYADLTAAYAAAKKSMSVDADLAEAYTKAEKRHESIVSSKSQRDQQFNAAMNVYTNTLSPDFGCVLFGPVASTGDEVDITIDTPLKAEVANSSSPPVANGGGSKNGSAASPAVSQAALVIPVVRRYAPTFSTGIVFTNLVNPTFSVNSSGAVVKKQADQFLPALGAMINTPLYYRSPDFTLQWSLGVALKNSNPLYVTGPSLIIGRRQRTVVTAGLAGSQVTEVSGPLSGLTPGSTVSTQQAFRLGWFVGLSYNFGPPTTTPSSTPAKPKKTGQ